MSQRKTLAKSIIQVTIIVPDKVASMFNLRTAYKYELAPRTKLSGVMILIRRKLSLSNNMAMFLFHNDSIAPMSKTLADYKQKKIQFQLLLENAFGDNLYPDIENIILDYLCYIPNNKLIFQKVLSDIKILGELVLCEGTTRDVKDIIDYINMSAWRTLKMRRSDKMAFSYKLDDP